LPDEGFYCWCSASSASAIAKLSKPAAPTATPSQKPLAGEQKETPQERLKRIMSKQLNKQSRPLSPSFSLFGNYYQAIVRWKYNCFVGL
jgi:hypothetical protein